MKVALYTNRGSDVVDHSYNFLIMTVTAELVDQSEENLGTPASKKNFKKRKPNLEKNKSNLIFGTTSVAANILTSSGKADEEDAGLKAYFVFSDISVRYEGYYRLNFRLFEFPLTRPDIVPGASGLIYRGGLKTDIFKVYNAKYFPGLTASPKLTVVLKKMGSRIRVRKSAKRPYEDDGEEKIGQDGNIVPSSNLKVLSEISSALRSEQGPEVQKNSSNNGTQYQPNFYNQQAASTSGYAGGYPYGQQYYAFDYTQAGLAGYGLDSKTADGIPIPLANVVAAATEAANAAVNAQQQQQIATKVTSDENIDDEFKRDALKLIKNEFKE